MKHAILAFSGLAALAIAAAPAAAENPAGPDWKAADAAFHDGKPDAKALETSQGRIACAGYWLAWAKQLEAGQVTPVVLSGLDPALGGDATKAELTALGQGLVEGQRAALLDTAQEAELHFVVGSGGDAKAWHEFFARLGTCRVAGK